MSEPSPLRKSERLNLRVSTDQKQILEQAAELLQTSCSAFMMEAALGKALQVIEDSSQIRLKQADWQSFCDALDAEPAELPGLKALLSKPGLFDWD